MFLVWTQSPDHGGVVIPANGDQDVRIATSGKLHELDTHHM
jgi:hypothetical protein